MGGALEEEGIFFPSWFQSSLLVSFLQHTTFSNVLVLHSAFSLVLVSCQVWLSPGCSPCRALFLQSWLLQRAVSPDLGPCSMGWAADSTGQQLSLALLPCLLNEVLLVRHLAVNNLSWRLLRDFTSSSEGQHLLKNGFSYHSQGWFPAMPTSRVPQQITHQPDSSGCAHSNVVSISALVRQGRVSDPSVVILSHH